MIANVLREIGGVGIYGVISVCLFFVVFGVALLWSLQLKKPFLQTMGALPLEDEARPGSGITCEKCGAGPTAFHQPEKGDPCHD